MTGDPWLRAMFDDVCERMSAMLGARGDRLCSRDEEVRYGELVRELAEINHAMHEAGADAWFPRQPTLPKERLTAAHSENVKPNRGQPLRPRISLIRSVPQ
jgi:hypothetical protein